MFDPTYSSNDAVDTDIMRFLRLRDQLNAKIDTPRATDATDEVTVHSYAQWTEDVAAKTPWRNFYQHRFKMWENMRCQWEMSNRQTLSGHMLRNAASAAINQLVRRKFEQRIEYKEA